MPRGNPSPKLAITVDADVHAEVVEAAAAEGLSVSAWMTAAARRALRVRSGLAAVAEWEAEHGSLTGEELDVGIIPVVPAPIIAQVSCSPAQVQLRRLLRGCEIIPLTEQNAHAAGELMGRAATRDVVAAVVARTAADLRADVVTGDRADIGRLLQAAGAPGQIIDV
jgi:hypothetical protein